MSRSLQNGSWITLKTSAAQCQLWPTNPRLITLKPCKSNKHFQVSFKPVYQFPSVQLNQQATDLLCPAIFHQISKKHLDVFLLCFISLLAFCLSCWGYQVIRNPRIKREFWTRFHQPCKLRKGNFIFLVCNCMTKSYIYIYIKRTYNNFTGGWTATVTTMTCKSWVSSWAKVTGSLASVDRLLFLRGAMTTLNLGTMLIPWWACYSLFDITCTCHLSLCALDFSKHVRWDAFKRLQVSSLCHLVG